VTIYQTVDIDLHLILDGGVYHRLVDP
jgi:hypothetical protein